MKKYYLITFILSIIIISFFINSNEAILITKENIGIFFNSLLPSLFPYIVLVLLFIYFKCHLIIAYFLQYISIPIFGISGKSLSIIIIGIIGGYPLIALLGNEIIDNENKKEINKLIPLFSFPSFAFLNNIIKFKTNYNYLPLFIIASLIILLFSKENKKGKYITYQNLIFEFRNLKFSFSFLKEIFEKAINNIIIIFASLLFFSLFKIFLNFKNEQINYLLLGLFEFSSSSIKFADAISSHFSLVLEAIILLFGGLSINLQILSFYSNSLLKYKTYIKYRLLLILIISLLVYIH